MIEVHGIELQLEHAGSTPTTLEARRLRRDRARHRHRRQGSRRSEGIDHPKAVRLHRRRSPARCEVGRKVAIIGAGGIGFDVAELITHAGTPGSLDVDVFAKEWGIDFKNHPRGGVTGVVPEVASRRARGLAASAQGRAPWARALAAPPAGRTRITLQRRGVRCWAGSSTDRIDDAGLRIRVEGEPRLLPVDTVIICAGQ
jgi:2,4-dienoyl-CoA reductase (NADPH2)